MASWPRSLSAALIGLAFFVTGPLTKADSLTILGASSLTDVLPVVVEAWKKQHPGVDVKLSFDASSRLAAEIDQGVPADLFFSADTDWMDHIEKGGKILKETRRNIVKNEIVAIVPAGVTPPKSADDLKDSRFRRIALAGENVPISKYAKSAFEHLHVWAILEPKIVRGENVRTDLKWVEGGEADAGVVYRSDAVADHKVIIAFAFPKDSYPAVIYPGAVLVGSHSPELGKSLIEFCVQSEARGIFKQMGFQ